MSTAPAPAPAYRVNGPTALGDRDPARFWNLTRTLAATDWKVRFYGVILLLAMILYFFFGEVTGAAVTSMVDRESLLRKVGFPRAVVPLSVALVAVMNLALNLVVLAIFVVLSGVSPRWTWLLLPIPFALMLIFATGTAMLLSALYVRYRDIRPIWEVVLQALFYATPILYPIEAVIGHSETLAKIALLNPLAALIQESRHLLTGAMPLSEALGSSLLILVPLAILVAITWLGLYVFDRMAPHAAEEL